MVSSCNCAVCAISLQFKILWKDTLTDYNPSVFHRELKKIYGIMSQSPTESPTVYNPSVFHRELKKFMGLCHNRRRIHRQSITRRYFIGSWKTFTGLCHNHRRSHRQLHRHISPMASPMDYSHPKARAWQTRGRLTQVPTDRKV